MSQHYHDALIDVAALKGLKFAAAFSTQDLLDYAAEKFILQGV
jgi:hypothetical protein